MNSFFSRRAFVAQTFLAVILCTWLPIESIGASATSKLRLGTLVPAGSSHYRHLQAMGEQWRKDSNGALSLTIYADGTMGGEAEMVRRIRIGQLQAGLFTAVGLSELEPAVTGLQNIPMMFRSLDELDYIGEKLQPMLEQRLRAKGFVVLFWVDAGWVRFFSKQPAVRPAEMKKEKLFTWAGNTDQVQFYRSLGFQPVPLETADILPSLRAGGLITAVPMPPFAALAGQVDQVAPHMLELNWAPLVGAAVISEKAWNALPAASRQNFMAAAKSAGVKIKADARRETTESVEAMKKRGLTVHPVSPAVEAEWRQEAEKIWPKVRGSMVPAEIFDEVSRLVKEYRAGKKE